MEEPPNITKKIDTGQIDSENEIRNHNIGTYDQEGCNMVQKPKRKTTVTAPVV